MEWWIWFTWWFLFNFRDSRLFEFIIKNHETLTENPPVQIHVNRTKNRIVFKVKTGCKLELLTLETMTLLGRTKKDVDKDFFFLFCCFIVHCNLVKNDCFVPNKQFGQLTNNSPHCSTIWTQLILNFLVKLDF